MVRPEPLAIDDSDPLADLRPRQRSAEKKARLLALAKSILAARKRGVSLADIATRLGKLPKAKSVRVSPDYLNVVMAEFHGDAWPKSESTGRKKTQVTNEATQEAKDEARGEAKGRAKPTEPDSGPSLETNPKSKFLKMEGPL